MGLDKTYNQAFIGCGRLGQALISYITNNEPNYHIVALCDDREDMIGTELNGIKIMSKPEFQVRMKQGDIDILALTLPGTRTEDVAKDLEGSGIKGVWNFGHTDINIKGIHVMNVYLSDTLHSLTYYINHPD